MDDAGSNVLNMETSPFPFTTLDEETRVKLVKIPHPKVSQIRKGTT